ncbi:MAG: biopolymer transporter ExbD [Planctomycetota bacterium]|nr:MAG: biopolymer transporter ExbD [Planctomycetota bacterium]
MRIKSPDEADDPVMNLTPLIDVMFNLLLFFMLATTFLLPERNLEVELPQARAGQVQGEAAREIVLNVTRDGGVLLSGRRIDYGVLERELRAAAARDPRTPVTIRGDRRVEHQAIVRVLDACRLAGLANLSLGTSPTSSSAAPREG